MRVTYLDHSGFMVETPEVIMVFDYYRDPSHSVVKKLEENPDKPVAFFVSHHHHDHYNDVIFNLGQSHKRVYFLSNDVLARDTNSRLAIQGMSPGDKVEGVLGGLIVEAYNSTDEGVAYAVTTKEGKTIFHAGDLNNWHWEKESAPSETAQAEAAFTKVVNRIAEEHPSFDVVFFPVDVRQGEGCAKGAAQFLDTINVANFFPMHFDGDYKVACDFTAYPVKKKLATTYHCMHSPGQSIELGKE